MVNSVKYPQFDASPLTAAANVAYISDRVAQHQKGNMITSLKQYLTSAFVVPIPLTMPGLDQSVLAGMDSRGSTLSCDFTMQNLTIPAAVPASQTTAALSAFGVIQVSEELRVSGNRQVSVAF